MGYLKSVERALEQSKDQVRLSKGALGPYEHTLPQLVLPNERLAMDGLSLGPELLSCQVENENFKTKNYSCSFYSLFEFWESEGYVTLDIK